MVQCETTGGSVLPVGLYSDGIRVGEDGQPDTLYVIYLTFLHMGTKACTEMRNKFIYTVYRKSDCSKHTLDDIWDVLLWELQALQHGQKPQPNELGKPLASQAAGVKLCPGRSRPLHVCLFQVRGDWAWFAEALGAWQWNCKAFMCVLLLFMCRLMLVLCVPMVLLPVLMS